MNPIIKLPDDINDLGASGFGSNKMVRWTGTAFDGVDFPNTFTAALGTDIPHCIVTGKHYEKRLWKLVGLETLCYQQICQ